MAIERRSRWHVLVDGHVMHMTAVVVDQPDLTEIVSIYQDANPGSEVTVIRVPVDVSTTD